MQSGLPLLWQPRFVPENEPHRVVCCEVLNLPSQVGVLPGGSALALAYRVTFARVDPHILVLAQNAKATTRAQ